jgi:hypothetical protein
MRVWQEPPQHQQETRAQAIQAEIIFQEVQLETMLEARRDQAMRNREARRENPQTTERGQHEPITLDPGDEFLGL